MHIAIPQTIRQLRLYRNLSQESLADALGVSTQAVSKWECGKALPDITILPRIAQFFHVSIDYLLDNQSEVSDNKQYHHVDAATSGARLKAWRKENKLTQEKLAGILNTTHSNIAFYEKGRNLIATPFLYMICHKYHVSDDYLLGRIDYNI